MKILSRDFTLKEKILILLLVLVLLALAYYQFVDQPVRQALLEAESEKGSLETEIQVVETKIEQLAKMKAELERIQSDPNVSYMPSYNYSKPEIALLNDILKEAEQYSISFTGVSRDGDQIRRNFNLQFSARDYPTMRHILSQLAASPYRCLIGDVHCNTVHRVYYYYYDVPEEDDEILRYSLSANATFFETMVGGVADAGLPQSDRATQ